MARAHLKLKVQHARKAELEQRFKAADVVRQRQRLPAILPATTGPHGYQNTFCGGTSGAAYAEAFRFDEAVSSAQRVCSLALTPDQ